MRESQAPSSVLETRKETFFYYKGVKIYPAESSSYTTVNFSKPENKDAIITSLKAQACAIVVIKNAEKDIVTVGHFYPANAYNCNIARKNLQNMITNFMENGGNLEGASIGLFGGGIKDNEDLMETTPLGPLSEELKGLESKANIRFKHHDKTITNLDRINADRSSITIFVQKDKTAVTQSIGRTSFEFHPSYPTDFPKDIEFLARISTVDEIYDDQNKNEFRERVEVIDKKALTKNQYGQNTSITMDNMTDVVNGRGSGTDVAKQLSNLGLAPKR